jgi:hypothetical protein
LRSRPRRHLLLRQRLRQRLQLHQDEGLRRSQRNTPDCASTYTQAIAPRARARPLRKLSPAPPPPPALPSSLAPAPPPPRAHLPCKPPSHPPRTPPVARLPTRTFPCTSHPFPWRVRIACCLFHSLRAIHLMPLLPLASQEPVVSARGPCPRGTNQVAGRLEEAAP